MINTRKVLKEYLREDLTRNFFTQKTFLKRLLYKYSTSGRIVKYLKILRHYEYHINNKHKIRLIYYKIKKINLQKKFNIEIPPNCFGPGLRIPHPYGIFVGNNAKIGRNCTIYQMVTIGANLRKEYLCPSIGDDCIIGAGAIIIGDVCIGNNVFVGAGAVVTTNFEDDSIIGGVPAKIIKKIK